MERVVYIRGKFKGNNKEMKDRLSIILSNSSIKNI